MQSQWKYQKYDFTSQMTWKLWLKNWIQHTKMNFEIVIKYIPFVILPDLELSIWNDNNWALFYFVTFFFQKLGIYNGFRLPTSIQNTGPSLGWFNGYNCTHLFLEMPVCTYQFWEKYSFSTIDTLFFQDKKTLNKTH